MTKHWAIEVKSTQNTNTPIGSIYHTDKQKNNRISELLENGFDKKDISVKLYLSD